MNGRWIDFSKEIPSYKGLCFIRYLNVEDAAYWDGEQWIDKEGSNIYVLVDQWFEPYIGKTEAI